MEKNSVSPDDPPNPTAAELERLNRDGGALADQLLDLLRPHAGDYGAVLSALQMILSRSPCGVQTDLQIVANLVAHNFGPDVRLALPMPPDGDGGDNPTPPKAVH